MKNKDAKKLMVNAVPKLADVLSSIEAQINSEISEFEQTPDQEEWQEKVFAQRNRIHAVLVGEDEDGEDWKPARRWADVYLSLFVLIHRGHRYIRSSELGAQLNLADWSAAQITAEIIKGHFLFWLSRSSEGYWTFPVKAVRDGLRRSKKLETMDRLDQADYTKQEDKVLAHTKNRIGDSILFFAVHIVVLMILRDAAKRDQQLKHWLKNYDEFMDLEVDGSLNSLQEGKAKGFGYSKGVFLEAKPGGVYKPRTASA